MIDELTAVFDHPVKEWCFDLSRRLWPEKLNTSAINNFINYYTISREIISENHSVSQIDTEVEISHVTELEQNTITSLSQSSELELFVNDNTDAELTSPSVSSVSTPSHSELLTSESSSVSTETIVLPPPESQVTYSFKIVGHNLDKYVKPRHETVDHHSFSLHYIHSYAVQDRCSTAGLQDRPCLPDITLDEMNEFLMAFLMVISCPQ